MKRYVLDTSALLTLRDDEPGAERVAEVLHQAAILTLIRDCPLEVFTLV